MVYSLERNQILRVYTDVGSTHDFKMFKSSKIFTVQSIQKANTKLDSGFQGVKQYLPNSHIPIKKSKHHILTSEEKQHNTTLAKKRIKIENINREIKVFRICKETRRHKQKKHNLFWTIVAGMLNFKHTH